MLLRGHICLKLLQKWRLQLLEVVSKDGIKCGPVGEDG